MSELRDEGIAAVKQALDRLRDAGVWYGSRTVSEVAFDAVVASLGANRTKWAESVRPGLPIHDNVERLLAALADRKDTSLNREVQSDSEVSE